MIPCRMILRGHTFVVHFCGLLKHHPPFLTISWFLKQFINLMNIDSFKVFKKYLLGTGQTNDKSVMGRINSFQSIESSPHGSECWAFHARKSFYWPQTPSLWVKKGLVCFPTLWRYQGRRSTLLFSSTLPFQWKPRCWPSHLLLGRKTGVAGRCRFQREHGELEEKEEKLLCSYMFEYYSECRISMPLL